MKKTILFIFIFIIISAFINSRRVKQENFDLIVLFELNDVLNKCYLRKTNNLVINQRLKLNDSLYNFYIESEGIEICNCKSDSIKKIIEIF